MAQEVDPMIIVPEDPQTDTVRVPVLKVFDGDGFLTRVRVSEVTGNPKDQAEIEVTARFGFIDAPEIEQPGGREAKDFLTALIGGKWVELAILMKMNTGRSVDTYGRVVCVPYLTLDYAAGEFRTPSSCPHVITTFGAPFRGTRNIELEMVVNGWAWVLERYGPDQRYLDALEEARRAKRGIWAFKDNIHPWEFKKQKYRSKAPKHSCPTESCRGHLVRKRGRFGEFLGCSEYPRCRYSCSVAG